MILNDAFFFLFWIRVLVAKNFQIQIHNTVIRMFNIFLLRMQLSQYLVIQLANIREDLKISAKAPPSHSPLRDGMLIFYDS